MYAAKADYQRAIKDYDRAIRLSPGVAVAFYNRGVAYARTQDFDRAIQDYNQALRLDPNYAWAHYRRGEAYANKRDFDRASGRGRPLLRYEVTTASAAEISIRFQTS
jgi:tetratricopeptide (TPR) repeat protein